MKTAKDQILSERFRSESALRAHQTTSNGCDPGITTSSRNEAASRHCERKHCGEIDTFFGVSAKPGLPDVTGAGAN